MSDIHINPSHKYGARWVPEIISPCSYQSVTKLKALLKRLGRSYIHLLYAAWFPSALYWWLLIKICWPFVKPYNGLICCYITTKKLLTMIASHYRYIRTSNCNRNTGSALGIRIECLTMAGFYSLYLPFWAIIFTW